MLSLSVDVASAFRDRDGEALTYAAASSAPEAASGSVAGSVVTVTATASGRRERPGLAGPRARRGPLADRPRRDVREHGGRTVRYGRRGSLRLTVTGPAAGTWTDHEAGASGGGLALLIHVGAADSARAAVDWLRQHGVDPPESPHRPPNGATPARNYAARR